MATVTRTPGDGRKRLADALRQLHGAELRVGWFSSAKYPNGPPVAYVASIHEYGYEPKHIAPRMGLRALIPTKQGEWAAFAEQGARGVLAGTMTVADALTLLGTRAEADFRKQIASVKEPVLAEATLAARAHLLGIDKDELSAGGMKPLVEPARKYGGQGLLIATVSHVVYHEGTKIAGEEKTSSISASA